MKSKTPSNPLTLPYLRATALLQGWEIKKVKAYDGYIISNNESLIAQELIHVKDYTIQIDVNLDHTEILIFFKKSIYMELTHEVLDELITTGRVKYLYEAYYGRF